MAVKLQHHNFISSRREADLDYLLSTSGNSRKRYLARCAFSENGHHGLNQRVLVYKKIFCRSKRLRQLFPYASAEEGVTVNGSPQARTDGDGEEMMVKLNCSLQDQDYSDGLVQSLHDAARIFELAIKEQSSLSKLSWFSTAWLVVDRNSWVKALSYQASVFSLLQAATEISSRGDGRDRDVNVFVQRSLLRQSAPLESMIRDELSAKQPEAYEWFWSQQIPMMVTSFVNYFEGDARFLATTSVGVKGKLLSAGTEKDISLLMLALTCIAAIIKLGPAKVSCSHFSSMIPEVTGRLMDMLVGYVPIAQAYHSLKNVGLRREFLVHFGPRAAACKVKDDRASDEVTFWVDLVQKQLQRAIDREKIWSRLTTSESIEVLERDLAIFGFFIALGRSTQSFLSANGFDTIGEPVEGFVRYLIGGSVLYYPQLSSISSYQLYVEVVCEELDWIPFYPGILGTPKQIHGHRSKREGPPNAEAIPQILDVCSHWIQSFIKYSKWLENPSNVKAARFLSKGHNKLVKCMEELGISRTGILESNSSERNKSTNDQESDSFDKALESVEGALLRLEKLFQELHVSSSYTGKEHLKAACSDLEKIRKLKKEAEFLEASFRVKAAFLQQGDDDNDPQSSVGGQQQYIDGKNKKNPNVMDRSNRVLGKSNGLWSFFVRTSTKRGSGALSAVNKSGNELAEQTTANIDSESNEIRRFELLRNELIELEKRVQRSTEKSENEEDITVTADHPNSENDVGAQLVQNQKKENIIEKSLDKLKETTTDVWQGTQLLAIDVVAAMGLLRRALIGDDLTEKEKKALQRTMTDLASVVPIGVLMLLPVTAVGHAAMLAAIQRYVPALIPSTYGPERLALLRQLEKVKEMQTSESDPEENVEE